MLNKLASLIIGSDIKRLFEEVTQDSEWSPSINQLQSISDKCYDKVAFQEFYELTIDLISTLTEEKHKRIYKTLLTIEYLILNGPDTSAAFYSQNLREFRKREDFYLMIENREVGGPIRDKAGKIIELITNQQKLESERLKAQEFRKNLTKFEIVNGSSAQDVLNSKTDSKSNDNSIHKIEKDDFIKKYSGFAGDGFYQDSKYYEDKSENNQSWFSSFWPGNKEEKPQEQEVQQNQETQVDKKQQIQPENQTQSSADIFDEFSTFVSSIQEKQEKYNLYKTQLQKTANQPQTFDKFFTVENKKNQPVENFWPNNKNSNWDTFTSQSSTNNNNISQKADNFADFSFKDKNEKIDPFKQFYQ